jgi:hypothetical protein
LPVKGACGIRNDGPPSRRAHFTRTRIPAEVSPGNRGVPRGGEACGGLTGAGGDS